MNNNNLDINFEKTKIMYFYQRIPNNNLDINYLRTKIEMTSLTNNRQYPLWKPQIDDLCKKNNKLSYAKCKLAKIVNLEFVLMAYHSCVSPTIRYMAIQ